MTVWAIGIDIGGTFTDVVALNYGEETLHSLKVPVFVRTQDQAAPLAVNIAKYQETGRTLYIGLVSHIERPSV